MTKLSIIIPVYYNADTLEALCEDLKKNFIAKFKDDYEFVFVDDGSKDDSYAVIQKCAKTLPNTISIRLSRNFGSHSAILCGLEHCTGDCAVVKAADLQEPTSTLIEMYESWQRGNKVVLAVRSGRNDGKTNDFFSNLYYGLTQKVALPTMPKGGFDIYLIDRLVINELTKMSENDSALTGQILWLGYTTGIVTYERQKREVGQSRWTLSKKIKLVKDTLFGFSTVPITFVTGLGFFAFVVSLIWAIVELVLKLCGLIEVPGFTVLFIFNLFTFGTIMLTLGILGEYMWRNFNASRKRPPYAIEKIENQTEKSHSGKKD